VKPLEVAVDAGGGCAADEEKREEHGVHGETLERH
jgi:hypothetical protein